MHQPEILLFGVNHQTSSVAARERLRFDDESQITLIERLLVSHQIMEIGILSTCNRTEIYCIAQSPELCERILLKELADFRNPQAAEALQQGYHHRGTAAVRHLLEVASGLDSQILGENEILGQIKHCYEIAMLAGGAGVYLHRLFNRALQTGKQVRCQTGISQGIMSTGSAAADMYCDLRGRSLSQSQVIILGSGLMAKMAARQLLRRGMKPGNLWITSRSLCHAYHLAKELQISCFPEQHLTKMLARVDGVIAATGAPDYVLRLEHFKTFKRNPEPHEPENCDLICIDIGVPRNIEPEVGTLDNVALHNIDEFTTAIQETLAAREREVPKAETLIAAAIAEFDEWYRGRQVAPLIAELHQYIESVCAAEIGKYGSSFHPDDAERLSKFSRSLAKRIIRTPIQRLHALAQNQDEHSLTVLKSFFSFADGA